MTWLFLVTAFIAGLLVGALSIYFMKLAPLKLQLAEAEYRLKELEHFNQYCLNHAADVLTNWIDSKPKPDS